MNPTERFTARARDYGAGRPSYPEDALDVLFAGLGEPAALTVVDLGAGTGISARQLAARGASVIAVEPNEAMRQQAAPAAGLRWQDATAEKTGLPDASADLVVALQAFHWFEAEAAVREMVRITRPGGRVALLYNERDESDAFTAAYGELVRRYATDATERRREDARSAFAKHPAWSAVRTVECRNAQQLDRAGLHARTRSSSYLPREGPPAGELYVALDRIFDRYAVDGCVAMRLQTIVTLAAI